MCLRARSTFLDAGSMSVQSPFWFNFPPHAQRPWRRATGGLHPPLQQDVVKALKDLALCEELRPCRGAGYGGLPQAGNAWQAEAGSPAT